MTGRLVVGHITLFSLLQNILQSNNGGFVGNFAAGWEFVNDAAHT
jgi:hypothetical protein